QAPHGLDERQALDVLDEFEDVPGHAAAKAVIDAALFVDVEARCLLFVERAEADVAAPPTLQLHGLADQGRDPRALANALDRVLVDHGDLDSYCKSRPRQVPARPPGPLRRGGCQATPSGSSGRTVPVRTPVGRFQAQVVEYFGAAPSIDLQVFQDDSKRSLSRNDSPDLGFRYSLNPYRGCLHACAYCYARPSHEQLGCGSRTDFDRKIVVKPRGPALLRQAIGHRSRSGELILFSGN